MNSKLPLTMKEYPIRRNGVTDYQIFDADESLIGTFWHEGNAKQSVACVNALAGKNPEALAPLIEVTKVLRFCQDQMYAAGLKSEHRDIVKALAAFEAKHEH